MTTFDDTGMFEMVEETGSGTARPQRGRVVAVLVVAAALVVAGVVWLLVELGSGDTADDMSVELLTRPAEDTDAVSAVVVDETGIDPSSARLAATTATGPHYAARRWGGELCLVAVPDGDVPRVVCVAPSSGATVTLSGEDGSRVRLGADGASEPPAAEGWRAEGTNVWVLDAPTED